MTPRYMEASDYILKPETSELITVNNTVYTIINGRDSLNYNNCVVIFNDGEIQSFLCGRTEFLPPFDTEYIKKCIINQLLY